MFKILVDQAPSPPPQNTANVPLSKALKPPTGSSKHTHTHCNCVKVCVCVCDSVTASFRQKQLQCQHTQSLRRRSHVIQFTSAPILQSQTLQVQIPLQPPQGMMGGSRGTWERVEKDVKGHKRPNNRGRERKSRHDARERRSGGDRKC